MQGMYAIFYDLKLWKWNMKFLLPNFDCCTFPSFIVVLFLVFYYVAFDLIAVLKLNRT